MEFVSFRIQNLIIFFSISNSISESHDQTLIEVLLAHNNFQRQKIANSYEDMFGRVLADDIDEEAGGHFAETILALLTPAHIYSARLLYAAISVNKWIQKEKWKRI